jgi:hypothetical protein
MQYVLLHLKENKAVVSTEQGELILEHPKDLSLRMRARMVSLLSSRGLYLRQVELNRMNDMPEPIYEFYLFMDVFQPPQPWRQLFSDDKTCLF